MYIVIPMKPIRRVPALEKVSCITYRDIFQIQCSTWCCTRSIFHILFHGGEEGLWRLLKGRKLEATSKVQALAHLIKL
jgi:hypothetical protein